MTALSSIIFLATVFVATVHGAVSSIVVPNDHQNTEGNSLTGGPFNTGTNTMRYQQVFDSSQFSSFGSDPWRISGFSLRIDTGPLSESFFSTLTNIQVNLSTTTLEPDSLSPVFAMNVGADDRVVFGPGQTSIFGGYSPFMSPQIFDVNIVFSQQFIYDPAFGNLLLDVRNFGGGRTTLFDAVDTLGDPTSSVFALPVGSTTGTLTTRGLVIRFVANPVPEPQTLGLLTVGTVALLFFARNRLQRP